MKVGDRVELSGLGRLSRFPFRIPDPVGVIMKMEEYEQGWVATVKWDYKKRADHVHVDFLRVMGTIEEAQIKVVDDFLKDKIVRFSGEQ